MTTRIVTAAVVAAVVGAALGLFLGAMLGGNVATSFEFMGLRGYEAAGKLGLGLGFVAGGVLGALFARRPRR